MYVCGCNFSLRGSLPSHGEYISPGGGLLPVIENVAGGKTVVVQQ